MSVAPSRCPICRQPVPPDGTARPFCSARCRTIDLGQWLSGRYVIPGEQNVDEQGLGGGDED